MKTPWTVQLSLARYWGATVTVEAESLAEAIPAAIREGRRQRALGQHRPRLGTRSRSPPAAAPAGADPWDGPLSALPIPDRFTERGAPPVVTLAGPGRPGSIEVAGGTVRLRFVDAAGTVTAEVSDPPPPPGSKPVVTVSLDARGKPHATVRHGKAIVRILDD